METRKLLLGIAGLVVIVGIGYGAVNLLFISQSSDQLGDAADSAGQAACNSALDTLTTTLTTGQTAEIPESCFSDGSLVTDRLSDAQPGDSFRKTSSGIETVQ